MSDFDTRYEETGDVLIEELVSENWSEIGDLVKRAAFNQLCAENAKLRHDFAKAEVDLSEADILIDQLRAHLDKIRAVVEEQAKAKDDGLWFISRYAPEAYLQQELRELHRVIEETP